MRCKKHLSDLSSSVGVCATCLRDRLFALIAAQAQVQARARAQLLQLDPSEDHRKHEHPPPPPSLPFPRSVSPYVCHRKSENSGADRRTLSDQLFYSTPQIGPNGAVSEDSFKKPRGRFGLIAHFFRSKPKKAVTGTEPAVTSSDPRDLCNSSPSWFSNMLSGHQRKPSRLSSMGNSTKRVGRRPCRNRDRGMSPARVSDCGDDDEGCFDASGYSSETSQGWKQTPQRAAPAARKGGFRSNHSHNVSGFNFCLSPLVRASPNRHWNNQKGMPPDSAVAGEIRIPVKPHLSTASSFCANRSRKLADFGRVNSNY